MSSSNKSYEKGGQINPHCNLICDGGLASLDKEISV
jgi:hypothetical protein